MQVSIESPCALCGIRIVNRCALGESRYPSTFHLAGQAGLEMTEWRQGRLSIGLSSMPEIKTLVLEQYGRGTKGGCVTVQISKVCGIRLSSFYHL